MIFDIFENLASLQPTLKILASEKHPEDLTEPLSHLIMTEAELEELVKLLWREEAHLLKIINKVKSAITSTKLELSEVYGK